MVQADPEAEFPTSQTPRIRQSTAAARWCGNRRDVLRLLLNQPALPEMKACSTGSRRFLQVVLVWRGILA